MSVNLQYFVKIEKLTLTTTKGVYDLSDILQFMFYYTSLSNYHIIMNLIITDSQDALANWEVNLGDKLNVILSDDDGRIFKRKLYLIEVEPDTNVVNMNNRVRGLSFVFSSKIMIDHFMNTICKHFKMPKTAVFDMMFNKYFKNNDIQFINENKDNGIIEFWANYWKPYDILDFVLNQTYDEYYDYVLFDDGYKERLVSLSQLARQPRKYTFHNEYKNIRKAVSSLNIHESQIKNNMSFLKLDNLNGLGNIFYKDCKLKYGYKRANITPRNVSTKMYLIDNGDTNLYPKFCCDNYRANMIYSNYDCIAAKQKVGEQAFWQWHQLQLEMKGLLTRKVGEVAWVKMPILAGSISLNQRYDGRWLIHTIKTSIAKNGECNQVIKLIKNDYFMNETYNDTEASIRRWKE